MKKYVFEFAKRILKRYWALYSISYIVLLAVSPIIKDLEIVKASLTPLTYQDYVHKIYGGAWWFSIVLFTMELLFAFPADLVVHFFNFKRLT